MKIREEPFGGIVSIDDSLVYIDKDFMKDLGYNNSLEWENNQDYLSAPTEVHFSITNECHMNCPGCYVNSGKKKENELSFEELKKVVDKLDEIGVFHVAFGGGEATNRKKLVELAKYCKNKGIVPNITTNGMNINKDLAKKFRVFEQIHVSMDGLKEYYKNESCKKTFEGLDKGIKLLRKYNEHVGLNTVITKNNFSIIEDIFTYAQSRDLEGVLLLRYKPSGRANKDYYLKRLSKEQNNRFYELIKRLHKNYETKVYIDCSFVPMLSSHNIPIKSLEFFSVMGCDGGNCLIGINPEGQMNSCSFCNDSAGSIFDFDKLWHESKHFKKFREWEAKEPCLSCKYFSLCKGGCHIVSEFVTKDFKNPDPECPRVVKYLNNNIK